MKQILASTATTLLLASASVAAAHPGHGATEPDSLVHHLLEPLHVAVIVAVAVAACAGGVWALWRRNRSADR